MRPLFDRYSLPLPRRREGRTAALSVIVHVTIGLLVWWSGAKLVENRVSSSTVPRGGPGASGRPAMTWFALPNLAPPQAERPAQPPPPPPPTSTVATVARLFTERVKLTPGKPGGPSLAMAATPRALVGTEGDPSTLHETSGADGDRGTGEANSDVFGPTPLPVTTIPAGAPPGDQRRYEVRFWVRSDGRVTKIEVMPPIRDSDYRRRFMDSMSNIVFVPAKTRDGRPIDYVYGIIVYP